MPETNHSGPDRDEITAWIMSTYPDTVIAEGMGAKFFALRESNWPNFATIVTTDEHDMATGRTSPARP